MHGVAKSRSSYIPHRQAMLCDIYIDALLVDEELADQVRDAWNHSGLGTTQLDA